MLTAPLNARMRNPSRVNDNASRATRLPWQMLSACLRPSSRVVLRRVSGTAPAPLPADLPEPPAVYEGPLSGIRAAVDIARSNIIDFSLKNLHLGPVFQFPFFGLKAVMVCDNDLYKQAMKSDSKLLVSFVSNKATMLLSDDETITEFTVTEKRPQLRGTWRKLLLPENLGTIIPPLREVFESELARMISEGEVDLFNASVHMSGRAGTQGLMGVTISETLEDAMELDRLINTYLTGWLQEFLPEPLFYLPGTRYSNALAARKRLAEKLRAFFAAYPLPDLDATLERPTVLHFVRQGYATLGLDTTNLDKLIPMTRSLLIATMETTRRSFMALMSFVARDPAIMARLREEQERVIGKHGSELTYAALQDCKYAEAVARESLFLAPVQTVQIRFAKADISVGGYLVPKGSMLMFNGLLSQASQVTTLKPGQFPDEVDANNPASFKPERWLDPSSNVALTTFGVGPHTCIGAVIYLQEAKLLLSLLARNCDMQLVSGPPKFVIQDFTIGMKGDLRVRVTAR